MSFLNCFFNKLFDIILFPFNYLGDFLSIVFISLLTALIALIGYKYLSDSEKIKRTKGYIKGHILAIRLYKDFALEILSSFMKSLWYILRYFMLNFVPLIILIPILFPVFLQMDLRYGFRPFNVEDVIDVKLKVSKDFFSKGAEINVKGDLIKEFKSPVYIPSINEVSLRLKGVKKGVGKIFFVCEEEEVEKSIAIKDKEFKTQGLSSWRGKESFYKNLLNPLESSIVKNGYIEEISINYPRRKINFLFFSTYWWVYYLILVLIFALALKKKFNVEF